MWRNAAIFPAAVPKFLAEEVLSYGLVVVFS